MNWYQWLLSGIITGWILHWLWVIWDNTEPRPPEPPPEKIQQPAETAKTSEFRRPKEKINKLERVLEILDEKLATGEITEAKYHELVEKYKGKANSLKNTIAEEELLIEAGLKETKEVTDAIEGLCRLGYNRNMIKEKIQSIQTSGMTAENIMKAVMAKV